MDKVAQKQAEQDVKEPRPIILDRWARLEWRGGLRLTGYAFGHPNFPDNTAVTTSRVVWIDEQIGMAKTLNTVYILREKA